ncbi:MAG TPA: hypothetical protein VMA35_08895 [Candidatus Sulfopaludibacter sp.]|nr:hypothetical protein [Candidatus Sulfopaludibacter sp.]
MKISFWKKFLGGGATLFAMVTGMAVHGQIYFNGSINFFGGATLNGSLDTATAFTSFTGPFSGDPGVLPGATGDFASIPAYSPVTFSTFSFNPPASNFQLWTLTVGATTYTFDASSVQVDLQNSSFLNLSGTGTAIVTGYFDTPGNWTITDTGGSSATFTFGASTTVGQVPEPSVLAMGLSLAAMGWVFVRAGARYRLSYAPVRSRGGN